MYTVQTVFNPGDPHPVRVSTENIFGTVSLIFWSATIIVTVTYVWLVMRADDLPPNAASRLRWRVWRTMTSRLLATLRA